MKNLLNKIKIEKHSMIFDDDRMTDILNVVNKYHCIISKVDNCKWSDFRKWYITFYTTNAKWRVISRELKVIRVWSINNIPVNNVGKVYSTD